MSLARLLTVLVIGSGAFVLVGNAQAPVQTPVPGSANATAEVKEPATTAAQPAPAPAPLFTGYKDVRIGSSAEEVRDKLGKAEIDDKDGFYYRFDDEFAQIRVDKDKKVRLIAVTYSSKNKSKPSFAEIFGSDTVESAKPDGAIYRLVRFPQAGYWVAYSRTAGNDPSVTVTMQKMQTAK